jgi:CheY-like chemotaxis protein
MLVRLVCWNEELAAERVRALAGSGFEIDGSPLKPSGLIGQFKQLAPAAVLIDLDRLPSHGREVGVALRQSPATRHIPLVFAGGAPEKLERIRQELPDAVFVDWKRVVPSLKKAAARPLSNPVKPPAHMERYKGSTLATKLGLKPNTQVALIRPSEDFEELVGEWPEGVDIESKFTARTDLAIWFIRSRAELLTVAGYLGVNLRRGVSAWICYPKQSGRFKIDCNENSVREACLAEGLVDYKICSVDADWSGIKVTLKKTR